MNFNFPQKKGTGLEKLMPHASQDSIDLIYQMCTYDPEERIAAKQALRHPYFKEFRWGTICYVAFVNMTTFHIFKDNVKISHVKENTK